MIIHIFNERTYVSENLPVKASGMYPIYVHNEIIANVIADGGNWTIRLADKYTSKDLDHANPRLDLYKIYTITSRFSTEQFRFVATPSFNPHTSIYQMTFDQVIIGASSTCDIFYPVESNKGEYLKISHLVSGWTIDTNSDFFFVANTRAKTGQIILNGDIVFFYGLKVIFLGSRVIVSGPDGKVTINPDKLKLIERPAPSAEPAPAAPSIEVDPLPLYTEHDFFYKSPRLNYVIETAGVEIDEPPAPITDNDMPAVLVVGPQVTMAGASVLSMLGLISSLSSDEEDALGVTISLGTMIITIAGTLLWPLISRTYMKHRVKKLEKKRQKKYLKYLSQKANLLNFIKANQLQTLIENNPNIDECFRIVSEKDKRLWQRNITHDDFLNVRLGLGSVPTKLDINRPREQFHIEDDDSIFLAMRKTVNDSLFISDAPVTYNFTEFNIDAILGDDTAVKYFMDCLFLQILTFHSYTDLKLIIFTKDPRKWDYLKLAPHCWDNQKENRYFTTNIEQLSTIAGDLEKIFNARVANDAEVQKEDDGTTKKADGATAFKEFRPYYLFFIDDMSAVRSIPLINKILRYKKNLGFSIITTANAVTMLPNETSNFISVSRSASYVLSGNNGATKESFNADLNDGKIDMYLFAEKLANIPVPVDKGKYELPSSISFLELYNTGRVEQLNSLTRWSRNNPSVSLSVPIGIDQSGETFLMDIHEKVYGPHGLVAGTTGSGKSEWIVTYILSLAVNFNPDEVQFVLIDYKGGGLAKSFENAELGVKLPHLAGTITNLDKSEIFRSIAAIESELKRRQATFNAAREKLKEGSMDIYKYQQYYRKGLVEEPMSHLLIICDEFAELRQQEPDFMDQLISTSRIGRSLGVHLILATQKPSGVVNDQIWSNSKFKVCLKVQDVSDSNEVIRKPDAAYLKQTGAFYLQVGNNDYFNLGQSAWAGAKYYPSDNVEHKYNESIECINDVGHVIASLNNPLNTPKKVNQGEQLLNIVSYISKISTEVPLTLRPLWLPNIPTIIYLSTLRTKYHLGTTPIFTYNTLIGEYDEPRKQMQGPLSIDLAGGNIAIIGKADGSIDRLVSTIIWSSITERSPTEIAYYIIDFGAETLKKFAKFPQVGEVAFQNEIDKVAGILDLVNDEMNRRKTILSDYNGSYAYYNKVSNTKMGLMVVIINNYDILCEVFPSAEDIIEGMFRDAPKFGIIFIVTSNATNGIGSRQLQLMNHVILMQFNDDNTYRDLTDCRRGLLPKKVVGRGICKTDPTTDDSYCEFQTAMIAPENQELDIIRTYADRSVEYYKCKVKQLTHIPADATSTDMLPYITDLHNLPIGVNLYEKDIAKFDLLSHKVHLITTRALEENMGFVYGLASILSHVKSTKVRVIDFINIFDNPMLDIKFWNSDLDQVIAALEKDVLTRTDTQDEGVNIVIGIGQYKSVLSAAGIEVFQNLFNNLANSKKSTYVFIDNYDHLRTLRLESWFSTLVDTTEGLWLGPGLDSQSLFECKEVAAEDKKFNYPGLAFNIKDKDYRLIKTIMDSNE